MISSQPSSALPVALIWGTALAFYAVLFVAEDFVGNTPQDPNDMRVLWILAACNGLGGFIAALLLRKMLGRPGVGGALLALIAAVLITLLGSLLGGAFAAIVGAVIGVSNVAISLIRIVLGAISVPMAIAGVPHWGLVWVAVAALSHFLARRSAR